MQGKQGGYQQPSPAQHPANKADHSRPLGHRESTFGAARSGEELGCSAFAKQMAASPLGQPLDYRPVAERVQLVRNPPVHRTSSPGFGRSGKPDVELRHRYSPSPATLPPDSPNWSPTASGDYRPR